MLKYVEEVNRKVIPTEILIARLEDRYLPRYHYTKYGAQVVFIGTGQELKELINEL